MELGIILLAVVAAYLIGSFPTAFLVGKLRGVDIFKVGSGNMGATNVIRAVGLGYGVAVYVLDGLKGVLAVLLARALVPDHTLIASLLAAVAVVAGHSWSLPATLITGSVRGGKGAATASGTLLLLAPTFLLAGVLALAALIVLITRYVSLGVLIAVAAAAVGFVALIIVGNLEPAYILYLLVGGMIFVRHRSNILRLIHGTERRLGERA